MLGHADLKFRQIRAKDYILFKKIEKNSKVHLIVRVHLIVPTPVTIGFRGTHLDVLPYKTATVQSLGEIKPILETRDMGL